MVVRIKDGGTSQTTAEGARIALGLSNADIIAIVGTPAGAQPLDSDLTAIAALTTTSYGRSFLTLADASAGRTYLGLGTMATETASNYLTTASATATYLTISTAASTYIPLTGLTGSAGTNRIFSYSTAGSTRWQLAADNVAESGTNAGSGFAVWRYSDAGSFLGQPIYIQRSNGQIFFESPPSIGSDPLLASGAQTLTATQKQQARDNIGAANGNYSSPNLVANGHNFVGQINATATTNQSYFLDQWFIYKNTVSGGAVSVVNDSSMPPHNAAKVSITTAQANISANDQYLMAPVQKYEAIRLTELAWGASGKEKRLLVRFQFKGPAGTYSLWIRDNTTTSRNYVKAFTISAGQANTETLQQFIVPVPNVGTWTNFNTVLALFEMGVTLAASPNVTGSTDDVWTTSGSVFAAPGQSNGYSSTSNVFYIWNWGVYVDMDDSGKFPLYTKKLFDEDYALCKRYYEVISVTITTLAWQAFEYSVEKRAQATLTVISGSLSGGAIGQQVSGVTKSFRQTGVPSGASDFTVACDARLP